MIRLSRLSDYGIVILTRLAREPGRAMAASTLARATAVSTAMTGKILKLLVRADILVSQRGVRGGYALARPPETITVAQIIEALDGPIALTSCADPLVHACGIESLCPARDGWRRINRAIREALAGITLAEMARTVPDVPPPNLETRPRAAASEPAAATIGAR
ncbi:MAG: SUF system Fe-S cluster assembly regulator [Geminicoccaceae bacterium]|nr:MAG: SUF system Fe-S cluster assembly regulator [Geminicoccaceae bacterium]